MRLRRSIASAVAASLVLLGACGGDSDGDGGGGDAAPSPEAAATVTLKATTFDPADVSVEVGDTVLWKWQGGVQHNVRATDGATWRSKLRSKGQFTQTFDTAGAVKYVCDVHPTTMKGTVTVTE